MKNSISARSPLSPTLWPRSTFTWWRSLLLAVAVVFVAFLASAVIVGIVAAAYGLDALKHPSAGIAIVVQFFGVYVPVVLLLALLLPRLAQRSLRELGLRLPSARDAAWGVGGAVAMILVIQTVGAIEQSVFHWKITETAVELLKSTHGPMVFAFAGFACVAAPFVEELVFRGFLFNAFLRYMAPPLAALLSGVLFGIAHTDPHSAAAVPPLAAGGLVLAWVYYRSGALTSTIIAHGLFNATSIVGLLVFHVK